MNGSFEPHLEESNILNECREDVSSWYCMAASIEGVFCAFMEPVVDLVGFICNPITIYILLFQLPERNRHLIFLGCLSIADTIKLLQGPLWRFAARGLPYITNGKVSWVILGVSNLGCVAYRSLHTVAGQLVINIFIVASLDRLFTITWPKLMARFTVRQAWLVMFFTLVLSVGISATWLADVKIVYDTRSKVHKCWREHDNNLWTLASGFYYQGRILPFLLVTVVNVILTAKILQILRNRRKLQEGQKNKSVKLSHISTALVISWLALFNFVTTIFRAGSIITILFAQIKGDLDTVDKLWALMTFGVAITDLPCSLRWIFYFWKMERFRASFLAIIRCKELLYRLRSENSG